MNYEDYKLIEKLGKGSFGVVYLATNLETQEKVALKAYKENVEWEYIEEAAELAMTLQHPNLMKCYTFFHDRIVTKQNSLSGKSTVHMFTVLEYINGVNLYEMNNAGEKMDVFLPQIISGLKYLHSHQLIHRDIKPENILVANNHVKIIDYDFLIKNNGRVITKVGTPYFIAPEIFERRIYNQMIDNWALGVTIYFCLEGEYPFLGENETELRKEVLSDFEPDYSKISPKYTQIIKGLLTKDFKNRMGLNQVLTIL